MIHEVIVTTINENERVHIAPMGIKFVDNADKKCVQISPFKPSQTLDNLLISLGILILSNKGVFGFVIGIFVKFFTLNFSIYAIFC